MFLSVLGSFVDIHALFPLSSDTAFTPPSPVAFLTARTMARLVHRAAAAHRRFMFASASCPPVASANMVSPSLMRCAGRTAIASPSWETSASLFACDLVSFALVATTPIVVFCPARGCGDSNPGAVMIFMESSIVTPSSSSGPGHYLRGLGVHDAAHGVHRDNRADYKALAQIEAGRSNAAL